MSKVQAHTKSTNPLGDALAFIESHKAALIGAECTAAEYENAIKPFAEHVKLDAQQRQTIDVLMEALELASSRLGTVSDLLGDEGCIADQKEYRKFYEETQATLEKARGEKSK